MQKVVKLIVLIGIVIGSGLSVLAQPFDSGLSEIREWYANRSNTRFAVFKVEYRDVAPGVSQRVAVDELEITSNRRFITSRIVDFDEENGLVRYRIGARVGQSFPTTDFFNGPVGIQTEPRGRIRDEIRMLETHPQVQELPFGSRLVVELLDTRAPGMRASQMSVMRGGVVNELLEFEFVFDLKELADQEISASDLRRFLDAIERAMGEGS